MVASNICTWECSGSGSFNTWTEPFLHQKVVNLVVMSLFHLGCAMSWMMVMLKGLALSRTVMSLLEIERHPMTLFTISLCTRKPTPCSCLSSFPLKYTLWPPSVGISPDFFHLISHNPRMLHLYRSISCKSAPHQNSEHINQDSSLRWNKTST